jgi:DNA sulfur modification protein DndD
MKLFRLTITNFRQYMGTHEVQFATDPERPVTLFHGANGGGKTCLLNAFTWVLFGEFTSGMKDKDPDDLVPRQAIELAKVGDEIITSVQLVFDHDGREYHVRRRRNSEKVGEGVAQSFGEDKLELSYRDAAGETHVAEHPHRLIQAMIPSRLLGFFFIDGERIFDLSRTSTEQRRELQQATRTIMGIELIDQALRHLRGGRGFRGLKRTIEDEMEDTASDELKSLLDQKHKQEAALEDVHERLSEAQVEFDSCTSEIEKLVARLRELEPAAHLQQERDKRQGEIDGCKDRLSGIAAELKRIVAQKGSLAPLSEPARRAVAMIQDLRQRGELPAGIKRPFVDDLLAKAECICGRALSDDDQSRAAIVDWQRRAGLAELEERAFQLRGKFSSINDQLGEFWNDLDNSLADQEKVWKQLGDAQDRFDEISQELKGMPQEDVASIEGARSKMLARRDKVSQATGGLKQEGHEIAKRVTKLEGQIGKQQGVAAQQMVTKRRLDACLETISALEDLRALYEEDCRETLNTEVANVFRRINFKGYRLVLNDDYTLELRQARAGDETRIQPSQGENQVMVLSFIASMIDTLRRRKKEDPVVSPQDYPLVLDSPFGQLDGEHRKKVAAVVPQLTPQIVLLVSDTQWDKWVADEILTKVGKEYVISYYASQRGDPVSERSMTLGRSEYPLVSKSTAEDYAELVEVQR